MKPLIEKLKDLEKEYEMYSTTQKKNAENCKLSISHKVYDLNYTNTQYFDDLEYMKRCEVKAAAYWSFCLELKSILEKYNQPIDFVI